VCKVGVDMALNFWPANLGANAIVRWFGEFSKFVFWVRVVGNAN